MATRLEAPLVAIMVHLLGERSVAATTDAAPVDPPIPSGV